MQAEDMRRLVHHVDVQCARAASADELSMLQASVATLLHLVAQGQQQPSTQGLGQGQQGQEQQQPEGTAANKSPEGLEAQGSLTAADPSLKQHGPDPALTGSTPSPQPPPNAVTQVSTGPTSVAEDAGLSIAELLEPPPAQLALLVRVLNSRVNGLELLLGQLQVSRGTFQTLFTLLAERDNNKIAASLQIQSEAVNA